ncbi:uncharacterized protein LOC120429313 [Culex pipiens pallens]|uniref:uncharacterized protein LOC120429313 n=1 Tax=Culex pipiens pallens TaxID=42434 RepID=UPI0022AACD6D|nr:uncharacterized protein LOC120429313 [Culex pipiens pallens]XP_052563534.1 uncharacterized protein LOC120429313 [Culex pipiens pallens]
MSTRRAGPPQGLPMSAQLPLPYENEKKQRSKCMSFVCCMWKVFTCIFSHVTLVAMVVAYCFLGAVTFEHLEAENERNVKRGISSIRVNLTDAIWKMTNDKPVLHQHNWTEAAVIHLQSFEKEILSAMKKDGWDGIEDVDQIQWTFFGALFYSIIVITTIGYGHIAPKTHMGKISTIFYAILGIPLMLLCLSNIGDIMASSFRFLYWRVCCYVCTREPKRSNSKRSRSGRSGTIRQGRSSMRSQPAGTSIRRSVRNSQRSADSGFDPYYDPAMAHAYSDADFRYNDGDYYPDGMPRQQLQQQMNGPGSPRYSSGHGGLGRDRFRDRVTIDRERGGGGPPGAGGYQDQGGDRYGDDEYISTPQQMKRQMRGESMGRELAGQMGPPPRGSQNSRNSDGNYPPVAYRNNMQKSPAMRAQSLDRRMFRRDPQMVDFDEEGGPGGKTPILCNKYALEDMDEQQRGSPRGRGGPGGDGFHDGRGPMNPRSQSMPRQSRYGDRLMPDRLPYYNEDNEMMEMNAAARKPSHPSTGRRRERPVPAPSPRIMSPMGFAVHRQARHLQNVIDDSSLYDDEWDSGDLPPSSVVRPVPIWLCVFLVVSYIIAGAFMFSKWEEWSFLDSAYFCFITLTTIGFGDFVPAQGVKNDSEISIALCSLYLLFGIALLAMSFNLVQEEVISNVKSVARRLGILKEEEMDD